MKLLNLSVPHGMFPAEEGERVRLSLTNIVGLEMIDALVVDFVPGCGSTDKVVLEYDETLLPGKVKSLNRCNITGFQPLCDCCSARPCFEIFPPSIDVVSGTWFAGIIPTYFRLDSVKFFSANPEADALKVQILIDGEELFPYALNFDGDPMEVDRHVFGGDGLIEPGSKVEVVIEDAPSGIYYEDPWRGLTACLIGNYLPYGHPA